MKEIPSVFDEVKILSFFIPRRGMCLLAYPGESIGLKFIQNYSDICIGVNANHFEPIRKTFCISFDEKWSKINPS